MKPAPKTRLKLHVDGRLQVVVAGPDWEPADIKAALGRKGISLRALARSAGYSHFQRVLRSPWWAAEQIVAGAVGVPAEAIWPTRYTRSRDRCKAMTEIAARRRAAVQERKAA